MLVVRPACTVVLLRMVCYMGTTTVCQLSAPFLCAALGSTALEANCPVVNFLSLVGSACYDQEALPRCITTALIYLMGISDQLWGVLYNSPLSRTKAGVGIVIAYGGGPAVLQLSILVYNNYATWAESLGPAYTALSLSSIFVPPHMVFVRNSRCIVKLLNQVWLLRSIFLFNAIELTRDLLKN